MSIDQFRSTIAAKGVARPNRFDVSIFYPAGLGGMTNSEVNLRVKTIDMPGRNISTTTNETIYGPTHEIAMGLTYADEVSVTFILSSALEEKKWFDSWQEWIYNPRTYALNFYKDYIGNLELYQLNERNERTYGVRLLEVFPKTVNAISYTQDGVSAIQELSVAFAFKEWVEISSQGNLVAPRNRSIPETTPVMHIPAASYPTLDEAVTQISDGINDFFGLDDNDGGVPFAP